MNDAPLVSVVTPAYNVGPWIGQAMDSVLGQKESRIEYVVVDDGSTDDTAAIVAERADRDPRVRLIRRRTADRVGRATSGSPRPPPRSSPSSTATTAGTPSSSAPRSRRSTPRGRTSASRSATPASCWKAAAWWGCAGSRPGICDLDRLLIDHNPPHNGSSLVLRRSCFAEVGTFDASLRSGVDFDMWLRIAAKSSTPAFQGIRRWHVDMRLMRTGSISRDRSGRYRALETILAEYAPLMQRSHPGLAYVRPAVFAYRDGHDEIGDRWADEARAAGTAALRRDVWGVGVARLAQGRPRRPGPDAGGARRRTRRRLPRHGRSSEGRRWLRQHPATSSMDGPTVQVRAQPVHGPAWISTVDRAAPIQPISVSGRYVAARLLVTVGDVRSGWRPCGSTAGTPPPRPSGGR